MGFRAAVSRFADSVADSFAKSLIFNGIEAKSLEINRIGDDGFVPIGASNDRITGLNSNVVMAPVMWIMRTFTEAQAIVQRRREEKIWDHVIDHPLEQLVDVPNDYYDGDALWKATALSYQIDGNAYWLKRRNTYGDVVELWYIPHWMIQPAFLPGGDEFITHYWYSPGLATPQNFPFALPLRDVVHFRFGLDPVNPRYGLSPLKSLLREIATDDEAARFSEAILDNMGVPGIVVSPKTEGYQPNKDQRKAVAKEIDEGYSKSRRGKTLVLSRPTDIVQFGFDPNKLMLPSLRDISEERVCAALGVPASVVGFGAGLQSTKVGATMRELRRLAWVQCLIPMQKSLAKQLTAQLLPDFHAQLRRFRVRFDDSEVSAFQEDDELFAKRVASLVQGGILRVDRAQQMLGLEVDPTQQVYIRPANAAVVDEAGNQIGATPPGSDPSADPGADPNAEPSDTTDPANEPTDPAEIQGGDKSADVDLMLKAIQRRALAPFHTALRPLLLTNGNGKH